MAADIDKRTRYFDGQLLRQEDFNDEQAYHLDRARRHNRQFLTPGIAEGLQVTGTVGATEVEVDPGTAVDGEGRQIVLVDKRTLPIDPNLAGSVLVVISYAEVASDLSVVGARSETRWHEAPEVEIVPETGPPPEDTHIRLARFPVASGTVTTTPLDLSVRVAAGAQVGDEVTARKVTLRRDEDAAALWPALSSGATGRLDVAGALHVDGDLSGANLDAHLASTANPHGVTAAQAGALASIDGVSNPGGNVDLIASGAITLVPDGGQNRVTIGENHSIRTDNPHAVTAAQAGALPASDYDFAQSEFGYTSFYNSADGATSTIPFGFAPRFIWLNGGVFFWVTGGSYLGSNFTAFVNLTAGISYRGTYLICQRLTAAPYLYIESYGSTSYILDCYLRDLAISPYRGEYVQLSLSLQPEDPTTVILKQTRTKISTTYDPVTNLYINSNLFCFG